MKAFDHPLSPQEEVQYLRSYRDGDRHAREVLIERNLRLVAHIARKYVGPGENPEDLISIGTIGLIKAIDSFDCTRGHRLATYAARCTENEILMYLRQRKKYSREVSLFDPIGTDHDGNEISLLDVLEDDRADAFDLYSRKEVAIKMHKLIDAILTPRERCILIDRFGLGGTPELTQREIAEKLHISRSYVSRLEKAALHKLYSRLSPP